MESTPWARGRLQTHEFTSVRLALGMHVLVASVDETMSQMYLCDEDMDDDDLDPPITMQSIMNIKCEFEGGELTAPQAMAMMLDTHRSAMMVGKIILGGPKVTSVDDFHAGQWYAVRAFINTCFS